MFSCTSWYLTIVGAWMMTTYHDHIFENIRGKSWPHFQKHRREITTTFPKTRAEYHDHISKNTGGKSTLSRHSLIKHSSARLCAADSVRISTMIAMIRAKKSESSAWFLANRCSRQSSSNIWHLSTATGSSSVQRSETHTHSGTMWGKQARVVINHTHREWGVTSV